MPSSFAVKHFNILYMIIILFALIIISYFFLHKLKINLQKKINITYFSLTIIGTLLILFPTLGFDSLKKTMQVSYPVSLGISFLIWGQIFILLEIFKAFRMKKKVL